MLIWCNKQQKKAPVKSVEAENYEVEESAEAEEDIDVTDEVAELPEVDITSSVVRRTKKAKS